MATGRMLKRAFFSDAKINSVNKSCRLFFQGLFCFCEDNGTIRNEPLELKALIFPCDNDTIEDIKKYINEIKEVGLITLYSDDGKNYIYINNFKKHQYIKHPSICNNPMPNIEAANNYNYYFSEKYYQNIIINNWNKIEQFTNYLFECAELRIKYGRVDIKAICKNTNQPVIIELKRGKDNPTHQLLKYADCFQDSILIGITEIPLDISKKDKNITYYTFDELFVNIDNKEVC